MVCKDNQESSDAEFSNLMNKLDLYELRWRINLADPKNYYEDSKCFYFQLDSTEITSNNIKN